MKVLLNGATGGTNFGDFLFAEFFQEKVAEIIGIENVFWYDSRYTLSDFYKKYLNYDDNKNASLKKIDALICISGGYFCGNDITIKDYIVRYLRYFHLCIKCVVKKIPIAIIGVEVGISNNFVMNAVQKYILKKAQIVVVRNYESLIALKQYGIEKGICTADTAHTIVDGLKLDKENNRKTKKIFFHIDPTYAKEMLKIIEPLNLFLRKHKEYEVYVGADQIVKENTLLDEICNKVQCERKKIVNYGYPTELCGVLNGMDLIITPKLHVGIVGATLSKSVISFSIHTEKIKRFYHQLGEESRTIDLKNMNIDSAVNILEEYHNKNIEVTPEIMGLSYKNLEYLHSFLNQLLRVNVDDKK